MEKIVNQDNRLIRVFLALSEVKLIVPSITKKQLEVLEERFYALSEWDTNVAPVAHIWGYGMEEATNRINDIVKETLTTPFVECTGEHLLWLKILDRLANNGRIGDAKSITCEQLGHFIYNHLKLSYPLETDKQIYLRFANIIHNAHETEHYDGEFKPTGSSYGEVIVYYVAEIFGIRYEVNYNVFN